MPPKVTAPVKNQPNLFSFFRKADPKPETPNNSAVTSTPSSALKAVDSENLSKSEKSGEKEAVKKIVQTPPPNKITSKNKSKGDDDDLQDSDEDSPLLNKRKRILKPSSNNTKPKIKKLKSQLADSDEEWDESESEAFDDDDDESFVGSEPSGEDEDEEDDFIVDDDEDDDFDSAKKSKSKKPAATKSSSGKKPPLPPSSSGKKVAPPKYDIIRDETFTPQKGLSIQTNQKNIFQTPSSKVSTPTSAPNSTTSTGQAFQLPEGVVGPGSHEHNQFDFLKPENIRDIDGHRPDHPDYNPRTIKVPQKFLNEQTPAMAQWWQFKCQNMDTILFFKVGKFYELFHMDADVAYSELDLIYMKGTKAHSGFPEPSYGKFASILVSKGYRVARVEQTETPDMLKERNDSAGKGKKDKVVARELCSIMTKGTRTYCHLDDLSLLENNQETAVSTSLLLSIKEKFLETPAEDGSELSVISSVEYGITCVDSILGSITLAQFQDDSERTRFRSFLARYTATEILLEHQQYSDKTLGIVKLLCPKSSIEYLRSGSEMYTAEETLTLLAKGRYFPGTAKIVAGTTLDYSIIAKDWPTVLRAVVTGLTDQSSALCVSSLGGCLWQMRRSLIDYEILSMGKFFAYIPPDEEVKFNSQVSQNVSSLMDIQTKEETNMEILSVSKLNKEFLSLDSQHLVNTSVPLSGSSFESFDETSHEDNDAMDVDNLSSGKNQMILDEVALNNLEIFVNNYDRTETGSLWAFLNRCQTAPGRRLLRTWLSYPLYSIREIKKRQDSIEELLMHYGKECDSIRSILKKIPDLERLLARVHSNSLKKRNTGGLEHPDQRAIMFEDGIYNMRKIRDFVDLLNGFEYVIEIGKTLKSLEFRSKLLKLILPSSSKSKGQFPLDEIQSLIKYFRTIFDEKQAKKDGNIKPHPGINADYDEAIEKQNEIHEFFQSYLQQMKKQTGVHDIKYFGSGKDRYQLEVPINYISKLPSSWYSKSNKKTHRRYWTTEIENNLQQLMKIEDQIVLAQKDTLRSIFEKFNDARQQWSQAISCITLLDCLLALTSVSSLPNYSWPTFVKKDSNVGPILKIEEGRHPMLEFTLAQKGDGSYIPNDMYLGGKDLVQTNTNEKTDFNSRLLLLTGPNMGGKSTLLRQTCLIVILAQLGCRVPAQACVLTPVDRIFTRVGATDRILAGQSTFFVELAETSLILREATEDSLCILDELGRGTATFDGTAIAHSVVDYLVSKIRCRALFATHYHLLIDDWEIDPRVKLGHMDCMVQFDENNNSNLKEEVTFLYKLCNGSSPKSYGINVAKLAGMPEPLIQMALAQSHAFEEKAKKEMKSNYFVHRITSLFDRLVCISHANLPLDELVYIVREFWERLKVQGLQ